MGSAEDFMKKFHSLEGVTIGQRKRSFFNLLNENRSLKENKEVLDAICTNLKPETFLEELFRVEIFIFFRRAEELLEILKQGNDIFISKVIKQKWFFQEVFTEVEAEKLVNEYLPSMSFAVRMKVLRKLSKYSNPEKFDKIFNAVATRYGTFRSNQFFLGCSSDKIKQLLEEKQIKLNESHLKILHKKDPKIIEFFFNTLETTRYRYPKFFKYLYTADRPLYDVLNKKYLFNLTYGRRLTKRLVPDKKDEIIRRPQDFIYVIDMKVVIRKLGKDSLELFCNSLPSFHEFRDYNVGILRYFAKKYHYNLIFKTIPNHYNIKYVDHPQLIDEDLLRLEPDHKKRAELAKVLVDEGDDDYIKYLTADEAITLLKERINVTSDIDRRNSLVNDLVKTCNINKEPEALIEVIKYFIFRHKNDDHNVFRDFINNIENNFARRDFSEEMWVCFFELLTLYTLKHEENLQTIKKIQENPLLKFIMCRYKSDKFEYLYFLHKRNTPIEEELLKELFSDFIDYPSWGDYAHDFERIILNYIIDDASKKKLESEQLDFNATLIEKINDWNKHYPEDQINFRDYPFLVETHKLALEDKDYVHQFIRNQFRSKIFTIQENEYRKEYLDIYWRRFKIFKEREDFRWFLKHDPTTITKNLEIFLFDATEITESHRRRRGRYSRFGKSSRIPRHLFRNWYTLKKFGHLGFDEITINFCLSRLDKEDCYENRPQYVGCLSVVMSPQQYVDLADSYKPTSRKLDLKKEEDVKRYNLQCSIAEKFKYTRTYTVLPSLLNYCMGDYFQHARESLYSLLYKTPEEKLSHYLNYLTKKAVSVRKHALFFACELTTAEEVEEMMRVLSKTEGMVSLQKYLFSATIKYFLKNPQDRFFEMVMSNMLFITKGDRESHDLIVKKYNEIPTKYRAQYVQHAWEHFEKIIENVLDLMSLKRKLLTRVLDGDEEQLAFDFGMRIIKEHLYPSNKILMLERTPEFAFNFFINRKENDAILKTILDIVEASEHYMVFFRNWYSSIMERWEDDLSFFNRVADCYEKYVDKIENFRDFLQVNFLRTRLGMPRGCREKFSEKVLSFMDDLQSKYGHQVVGLFLKELKSNLSYFVSDKNEFCMHLLKIRPNEDIVAFVLDTIEREDRKIKVYNDILREIKNIPDEGIQIYLYWKHKNYLMSDKFIDNTNNVTN